MDFIDRTGGQNMIYLTCTTISGVDLAIYGVYCAKDLNISGLWYNFLKKKKKKKKHFNT